MADRILSCCLWLVIMGLITATAVGSLVLMYSGLMQIIARQVESGGTLSGAGLLLAGASWFLCRHSNDLIDR